LDGLAIVDQPRPGADNMAIDQGMLSAVAAGGPPLLRIYRWAKPTVSLGYFQKYADFEVAPCFQAEQHVRRATGGGAIVHHHDWTYSLAVPERILGSTIGASSRMYDVVHEAVSSWLRQLGWDASLWPSERAGPAGNPFLCFMRRSPGDIVVQDNKVLGSAQRRMQGGVLQHGSLLLSRSQYAPELPGLTELPVQSEQVSEYGTALRIGKESESWQLLPVLTLASDALGMRLAECSWREFDTTVGDWATDRFASSTWLHRV